ncbi:hypothetical protein CTheo_327 [Ceratobasidium theobromae]|uniref:GATA-type domain-containing protein n=1 Tax=Ceratobasidium theobromae TaxID=1582974 RepID=A0A5N5QX73_9AGAM|nr:hypothetical protein CTheo_327 [Ceratobasidium theobromae]
MERKRKTELRRDLHTIEALTDAKKAPDTLTKFAEPKCWVASELQYMNAYGGMGSSMSFEEHPMYDTTKVLYTEPQPLYSPGYVSEEWASSESPAYVPDVYRSEWSDVGPVSLPPYSPPYPPMYDHVKSEVVVPTQAPFPAPHVVHVVFTDDAASKETQYLRRRCHNCQQVEPPSWRRSHLVPGKIVCNRCGLYERTHLRPVGYSLIIPFIPAHCSQRPHRFDEVRAGKARKPKQGSRQPSPVTQFTVKQEVVSDDLGARRGEMAAPTRRSLTPTGSADWDDHYTSLAAGTGSRLDQHAQRASHYADPALAARFRAGRKSATAPYDVARPLDPDPFPRRHTLPSDAPDIPGWSSPFIPPSIAY